MTIETNHNEHKIRYSEQDDQWACGALNLESKTLSGLKAKINDFEAKERKLGKNGIVMLHLGNHRWHNAEETPQVRATMLDREDIDRYPCVWISHVKSKQREKVGLHSLVLDTPENHAVLLAAEKMEIEGKKLIKSAEKMRESIKRMSVAEIKAMALEVKP